MSLATLEAIQTKVRRITHSPTEASLSTNDLNNYINNFLLYDLPEHLRMFPLRQNLTFYTQPNVDTYSTNTTNQNDPLYNFKNKYITIHPPIFLAGVPGYFTQKQDVFFGYWPFYNTIASTQVFTTSSTGPYSGTVFAAPMLQNQVIFSVPQGTLTGENMILVDYPIDNQTGFLGIPNSTPTLAVNNGTINYLTGAFTLTWPNVPATGAAITCTNVAYQAGKPLSMLYFNDTFTIRPVPDKVYAVQLEVQVRPTQLMLEDDVPFLEQWWQFIAWGAARKVFEDKMDTDSIAQIQPEFDLQMRLCLRTTLDQRANERTTTAYTIGKDYWGGFGFFGGNGWPY